MVRRALSYSTVFFIGLSIVLSVLLYEKSSSTKVATSPTDRYPLLASRIFIENQGDVRINFQPLRDQVKDYFLKLDVGHSFYFEYLFTGSSIRNGDQNQLVGASLMKIPIVMNLYKAVEEKKVTLDMRVPIQEDPNSSSDTQYGNITHLQPGGTISLRDAADITLKESDNTAAYTIFEATNDLLPSEDQALNNLDIHTETRENERGTYALIGAKEYTSIMRCLYFSCFLSIDHSQEILDLLTKGTDSNRLRAGVPETVRVARKIGSFSDITQSDCGIIYIPKRRYALCIMLDEDAASADKHIKELSEIVYKFVSSF